jgi:hypothetical protein
MQIKDYHALPYQIKSRKRAHTSISKIYQENQTHELKQLPHLDHVKEVHRHQDTVAHTHHYQGSTSNEFLTLSQGIHASPDQLKLPSVQTQEAWN